MNKEAGKKAVALAALKYIEEDTIIGVGTGSTADYFIAALADIRQKIEGAVASSEKTAQQLKALNIPVLELNSAGAIAVYVDGADEVNSAKQMIKGGGAAATREKLVALNSKKFICIVDESKVVDLLGTFPVAVEVLPFARSYVAREIVQLGGTPQYREGKVTDNGNVILDVYNLDLKDPLKIEMTLKAISGVVESGVFAKRRADVVLVGGEQGVRVL